jgi:hypothetical protein
MAANALVTISTISPESAAADDRGGWRHPAAAAVGSTAKPHAKICFARSS